MTFSEKGVAVFSLQVFFWFVDIPCWLRITMQWNAKWCNSIQSEPMWSDLLPFLQSISISNICSSFSHQIFKWIDCFNCTQIKMCKRKLNDFSTPAIANKRPMLTEVVQTSDRNTYTTLQKFQYTTHFSNEMHEKS